MGYDVMFGKTGNTVLGLGNEAIARGALEAGVQFAAAYPGTPSSEILGNLALVSKGLGIYTEWSTNEKVAFEAATAAAWSGLRALASMKQNGLFVVLDSLINVAFSGHGKGGLVLVVADDPLAHSSTTEGDSRPLGNYSDVVVLEPFTHQQAKDIISYAFDLSEKYGLVVLVRETTRLAQSRAPFTLGEVPHPSRKAVFDHSIPLHNLPRPHIRHAELHTRLEEIRKKEFEKSPWNRYTGPRQPSLLIITSGTGWKYANEATQILSTKGVGILALTTLSPLPEKLILKHLKSAKKVLFLEEIDPYLETQIRSLSAGLSKTATPKFYGKLSGHIPSYGECNIDHAIDAISRIQGIKYTPVSRAYAVKAKEAATLAPRRALTFCPGCPHRAAYYSILQAIKKNKGKGFVTGDIGCYSLGAFYHDIMRSQLSMGAGAGLASGFGNLDQFGLDEPVIAVMGDSTFYHACLPALVNIIYTQSKVTSIIFDNRSTAMTGFQPHPGIGIGATGEKVTTVPIENLLKGIGFTEISVIDPFDIEKSIKAVYKAITATTSHAIVFRRECALITNRRLIKSGEPAPRFIVDTDECIGETCKICSVQFNCPACVWDNETSKARIDGVLCNGCGVCVQICPAKAITGVKR